MFYSQFILAKKGPLGTIWIAAHLERKLRKNQVADTDIGVSVDSILFPEAPIALRLSSHLLLGVVRIYSRKVNYLFHDCSEALLKIKQAFRSTAVDLPPEESTAPYHSITLPETFHLDDFELPDSAFQGNSVDHHVSTREQITLQDTSDGLRYSTSQFGLDERFGDGDTSQIGLDLEEGLFSDNVPSSQHTSVPLDTENMLHHDQHSTALNDMDIDQDPYIYNKETNITSPKELSDFLLSDCDKHIPSNEGDAVRNYETSSQQGYNIQTPDLNEVLFHNHQIEGPSATTGHMSCTFAAADVPSPVFIECAQAPSTPRLMEAISASVQEIPPLSPHDKDSLVTLPNAFRSEVDGTLHPAIDHPEETNKTNAVEEVAMLPTSTDIGSEMTSDTITAPEHLSVEPQLSSGVVRDDICSEGGTKNDDTMQNEFISNKVDELSDHYHFNNTEGMLSESASAHGLGSSLDPENMRMPLDKPHPDAETSKHQMDHNYQDCIQDANTSHAPNGIPASSDSYLRPCSSQLKESSRVVEGGTSPVDALASYKDMGCTSETTAKETVPNGTGSSVDVPGEGTRAADVVEEVMEVHQTSESVLSDSITGVKKSGELSSGANTKANQLDHLNCSSSSEFPEPEKMLLAPTANADIPNDLGQLTSEKVVTESDGSVDRIKSLSGKKHRLTDSISAMQDDNSAKLSGRPRLRRNSEYIPDDDDLLASILVGRTPNFKIRPTPLPQKVLKRPRLNPKIGISKRKVLLDDTMVLHADMIRQQLINTEDIRRIRKKAPCTRCEIWMSQNYSEELEIFDESIFTGISRELHSLHNRTYSTKGDLDLQKQEESPPDLPQPEAPSTGTNATFVAETDERHTGNPTSSAPSFENVNAVSADCGIGSTPNHEDDNTNASHVKSDEACVHASRQLTRESVVSYDELKEMNADSILLGRNISTENCSSLEDAVEDRMHNAISSATVDDDVVVLADGVCVANGATTNSGSKSEKKIDTENLCWQQEHHADVDLIGDGVTLVSTESYLCEDGTCLQTDAVLTGEENLSDRNAALDVLEPNSSHIIEHQAVEQIKGCLEVGEDDKALQKQVFHDEEHPCSEMIHAERIQDASSHPYQHNVENENIPSTMGENYGLHEFNIEGVMDVESTPMDLTTARESSDFCSAINGNATEFLNVDEEEDYCEADDDLQNPEEAQSLENSGWSSRTRGVARYLKSLFGTEYGRGRKVVAMDHLLFGKTRREASRMFFETLVLKTRDYIHVEQENPFQFINIKPQGKLMKSEF